METAEVLDKDQVQKLRLHEEQYPVLMRINTVHGRCQKEMYLDFTGRDNIQDPIYCSVSIITLGNRTHFCMNKR